MLKDWCEAFATWRGQRLQNASEWWTDLAIALRTGERWRRIRARRALKGCETKPPVRLKIQQGGL